MSPSPTQRIQALSTAILVAIILLWPITSLAQQKSKAMPALDPAKFVADDFSFDPIIVPFYGERQFDANMKYMAILQDQNFDDDRKRNLLIYELATGEIVKTAKLPDSRSKFLSISTDLSALVVESDYREKIEIWRLDSQVADGATRVTELTFEGKYTGTFSWCKFIDESNLIVVENGGKVQGFSAKTGKQLFESRVNVQRVNNSNSRRGQVAEFSSDHRFLCFMKENNRQNSVRFDHKYVVNVIDLSDGSLAAEIPLKVDEHYRLNNFRLAPNGKLLSVSMNSNQKRMRPRLAFFDTKTGELVKQIEEPKTGVASSATWLTNDLLSANDVIISFRDGRALCDLGDIRPFKTVAGSGEMIFFKPIGQHYKVVHPSPISKHWIVFGQKLDDASVRELVDVDKYRVKRLMGGDKVALNIDLQAKSPIGGFESDFRKGIADSLGKAGYVVDDSAKVKLNVTITETATGEFVEFAQMLLKGDGNLPTGKVTKIREMRLAFDMRFVDDRGEFAKAGTGVSIPSTQIEMGIGDTVESAVRKWRWKAVLYRGQHYDFYRSYIDYIVPEVNIEFRPDLDIVKFKAEALEVAAKAASGDERSEMGTAVRDRAADNMRGNASSAVGAKPIGALPSVRESAPWTVKPFTLKPLARGTLRKPMPLTFGSGVPDNVKLAYVKTKQAASMLRSNSDDALLNRYDLTTGNYIGGVSVPDRSRLLDFRLDGKFWVITDGNSQNRLRVYKSYDGEEEEDDVLAATLRIKGSGDVKRAWFSGADTLVVVRRTSIAAYSISKEEQVFERNVDSSDEGEPLVWVSADRSVFLQAVAGRLSLFKCKDGKTAGEIPMLIDDPTDILSVAFSPDGNKVAVLKAGVLQIHSLASGNLDQVLVNEELQAPIQWCDNNFVLSMNMLVSLDLCGPVWQYGKKWTDSPFFPDAHQAGWYKGTDQTSRYYLIQVGTPNSELRQQIGRYMLAQPKLIERGQDLSVKLKLDGHLAKDKDFQSTLTERIAKQLNNSGYKYNEHATENVMVQAFISEPEDAELRFSLAGSGKKITVPDYLVSASVSVNSKTGHQRQIDQIQFSLSSIDYSLNTDTDPQLQLLDACKNALVARVTEMPYPAAVYRNEDHRLGQSDLRDGIEYPILSKKGKELVGH